MEGDWRMRMLIAAVLVSGVLGILTDWLFMGLLFHSAYNTHPEVWRPGVGEGKDRAAITWSSILGFIVSAAVIALCALSGVDGIWSGLGVAFITWLAGPAVVVVVNGLFVNIDPRITAAHCAGYLVRMLIAGAAAGIVLPLS
jgi:hypothetical protein